jgi:hypothetical protein
MVILLQTSFFVAQLSRGGSPGFGADMVLPCIDVSIRIVHINALTKEDCFEAKLMVAALISVEARALALLALVPRHVA